MQFELIRFEEILEDRVVRVLRVMGLPYTLMGCILMLHVHNKELRLSQ